MTEEVQSGSSSASGGFREELAAFGAAIPHKILFLIAFGLWLALFHFLGTPTFGYVETPSIFGWLKWVYEVNPDDAIGKLIPLVVLGLFWWKRRELIAVPKQVWWPALGVVALALVFHVFGYMIQQERASVVAFFVGLYGLMGLFWGPAWLKACFFPYFLFVFCIPVSSLLIDFTLPLRLLVTNLSVGFSDVVLGINVLHDGTRIFNPAQTIRYDVAAVCSGIRSLIALTALTTVYGFVSFRSPWKRLLMIASAVPLAILNNLIRITGVLIIAEAFGQQAGDHFHEWAGFLTFGVALVCVMALGYWLQEERNHDDHLTRQPV